MAPVRLEYYYKERPKEIVEKRTGATAFVDTQRGEAWAKFEEVDSPWMKGKYWWLKVFPWLSKLAPAAARLRVHFPDDGKGQYNYYFNPLRDWLSRKAREEKAVMERSCVSNVGEKIMIRATGYDKKNR